MHVERVNSDALVVNQLPDGSRVMQDTTTDKLYALNPTAGAAWDACSDPTTLENVAQTMQRSFDPEITEEIAEEAILQLQDHNLVKTSESPSLGSRRRFLAAMGAAAVPLVVTLTVGDQRAYAEKARSGDEKKDKEKKEHG
jgi:Coenzyme PQQ synthesis protein D (PqqD)